jgi:hypothetical protein
LALLNSCSNVSRARICWSSNNVRLCGKQENESAKVNETISDTNYDGQQQ